MLATLRRTAAYTPSTGARLQRLLIAVIACAAATAATAAPALASGHEPAGHLTLSPNPATEGQEVTLDASGSKPGSSGAAITKYYWDFEADGPHEAETATPVTTHTFPVGQHKIRVWVEDADGQGSNAFAELTVNAKPAAVPPTARLTVSPNPATEGGEWVTLDASGSTPGGAAITKYYWDFQADGPHELETTNPVTARAFPAGEHKIRVWVEDADGNGANAFAELKVNPKPAYDPTRFNPWWEVPGVWITKELTMPDLSPRAKGRRPVRFRPLNTARAQLNRVVEKAGASVRILEQRQKLPDSYRDERRVKSAKYPLVLGQKPARGTKISTSMAKPETIVISYWDPAKDPVVKKEIKKEIKKDLGKKEKKKADGCKLVAVSHIRLQGLLQTKTLKEALKIAKGYGCKQWEAKFSSNSSLIKDIVTKAAVDKKGVVELKVVLPRQPDFVMTFREDPARLKSAHDLSLVPTSNGDWVLPKSTASTSRMTIQVNELATGRFAGRASGVKLEIYDESTHMRLASTNTDGNGEAAFELALPKPTSLRVIAHLERRGQTMQAARSISVKSLGSSFTTVCGRRIALKKVQQWKFYRDKRTGKMRRKKNGTKNLYRGDNADLKRCKALPIVPGNLGTGKGASGPRIPTVEEKPSYTLTTGAAPKLAFGAHNGIDVSGKNTIVGSAPGIIAAGGGNLISAGGGNRAARGAGSVRAQAAVFGSVGNLLNAIVTPLRKAWDDGVSNLRAMLPGSAAADLARTREALRAAGVPDVRPGQLVPEGVGIISAGGGNLISAGGGNIISTGGGNVINMNGGTLISDKGLGLIAAGGGNIIAAGGGNAMPVYGGRLIGQAGGI